MREQIRRIEAHVKKMRQLMNELEALRSVAWDSEERSLRARFWHAVVDCESEFWWLTERLERAENEKARDLNRLVDKEIQSRQEAGSLPIIQAARAPVRLDPQRLFSGLQKQEIYLRANGPCVACGIGLDSDWHADHIFPHSRGGKTEVVNGQALCETCNLRKSAKVLTVDE